MCVENFNNGKYPTHVLQCCLFLKNVTRNDIKYPD